MRSASESSILVTQEYSITRVDTNTIRFKGDLSDMAGVYLVMAASSIDTRTIILDSPGGMMYEASVVASYLRDNDVTVVIEKDTMCVSACAYAAMTAKKLVVDGKLVFHPPFFPMVSTTDSLYSIIHQSNSLTLDLAKWFLDAGYSLSLLKIIYETTDNTEFMVFESADNLYKFKSDNVLYLPENFTEYFSIVQGEVLFK